MLYILHKMIHLHQHTQHLLPLNKSL